MVRGKSRKSRFVNSFYEWKRPKLGQSCHYSKSNWNNNEIFLHKVSEIIRYFFALTAGMTQNNICFPHCPEKLLKRTWWFFWTTCNMLHWLPVQMSFSDLDLISRWRATVGCIFLNSFYLNMFSFNWMITRCRDMIT